MKKFWQLKDSLGDKDWMHECSTRVGPGPGGGNQEGSDVSVHDGVATETGASDHHGTSPTKGSDAETIKDDSFDSCDTFAAPDVPRKAIMASLFLSLAALTAIAVAVALLVHATSIKASSLQPETSTRPTTTLAPTTFALTNQRTTSPAPTPLSMDNEMPRNDDTMTQAPHASAVTANDESPNTPQCEFTNFAPPFPGKKGIGMRLAKSVVVENFRRISQLRVKWNYSWGLHRVDSQPDDIEFVPMIWGGARSESELDAELQSIESLGQAKRILAFNEPDQASQANLYPWEVIQQWPRITSMNLPIIGPSCYQPTGDWMQRFEDRAKSECLRVDYVGVHWYGSANGELFKQLLLDIYNMYQRPIVITEFAPADWTATTVQDNQFSPAGVLDFAKEVIPWLEKTDWVAAYAWFSFAIDSPVGTSSALFYRHGNMTALGRYYASVSTDYPSGDQQIKPDY